MGSTANEITMFIDTSKCIGCKACQVACKQWHSLPAERDEGTATSGSSTTLVDTDRTPTTPFTNPLSWAINEWANRGVEILTGTGVGQKRKITSNTADTLTVSPIWTTIPDGTSVYAITTAFNGSYTNPPDMSGKNLTVVKFYEAQGDDGLKFLFLKDQCRHCYQPKCKRGCPTGVYQTQEGFVLFSSNCKDSNLKPRTKPNPAYPGPGEPKKIPMTFADHCPYTIPHFSTTSNQYVKCDFCYDRFAKNDNGIKPNIFLRTKTYKRSNGTTITMTNQHTTACEYACPTGAIVTGSYAQIIGGSKSCAKERYRAIRRQYPFARLYLGRYGRVNVIYLLTQTADKYGLAK